MNSVWKIVDSGPKYGKGFWAGGTPPPNFSGSPSPTPLHREHLLPRTWLWLKS